MKKMNPADVKALSEILIKFKEVTDELIEEFDKGDCLNKRLLFSRMVETSFDDEEIRLLNDIFGRQPYYDGYNNPIYGSPIPYTVNWNEPVPNPIPPYVPVYPSTTTTVNPAPPTTFYDPLNDIGMSIFDKPEEKFVAADEEETEKEAPVEEDNVE